MSLWPKPKCKYFMRTNQHNLNRRKKSTKFGCNVVGCVQCSNTFTLTHQSSIYKYINVCCHFMLFRFGCLIPSGIETIWNDDDDDDGNQKLIRHKSNVFTKYNKCNFWFNGICFLFSVFDLNSKLMRWYYVPKMVLFNRRHLFLLPHSSQNISFKCNAHIRLRSFNPIWIKWIRVSDKKEWRKTT